VDKNDVLCYYDNTLPFYHSKLTQYIRRRLPYEKGISGYLCINNGAVTGSVRRFFITETG
jgi:hypothetical protein